MGKVYSADQCTSLTNADAEKAASGVLRTSPHLRYHPMQLAAAISFSYNVGVAAYAKSSVASKFNVGDFQGGCSVLLKYVYVNGKPVVGLLNRRKQEYDICVSTLTPKGLANVGIPTS